MRRLLALLALVGIAFTFVACDPTRYEACERFRQDPADYVTEYGSMEAVVTCQAQRSNGTFYTYTVDTGVEPHTVSAYTDIASPLPAGVTLSRPDGRYPKGLQGNDPEYVPIGVWLACVENQAQAEGDKALGLNLYGAVCANSDLTGLDASGMKLLAQANELLGQADHPAVDGWLLDDEPDMRLGPTACPSHLDAIAADVEAADPGALTWTNYGLGVTRWETDQEAACWVNHPGVDVVSVDDYHFTHPNPGRARAGYSYGQDVDRVRMLDGLDGQRKPVWGFVEVGHPFTETWAPTITPAQVRSAVWHEIIAGARGIVYFNHSWNGPCGTNFNVLRSNCDPAMAPMVEEINGQLAGIATVVNGPTLNGYTQVTGDVRCSTRLDLLAGSVYLICADTRAGTDADQTVSFDLAAGTQVEAMFEGGRWIDLGAGSTFTDTFTGANDVHIYQVSG